VADAAQLYRVGDTQECCIAGWVDDWSILPDTRAASTDPVKALRTD